MKSVAVAVALVAGAVVAAQGQQPPAARIDLTRLGPQKGQVVADFRLQDAAGRTWTRDSLMGPNGAMLVFSRSVDWCPYCKTQVIELQSRYAELQKKGLGLAVITYDPPAVTRDFSQRRGITFPLLSDPGSQTIRAYGILNTTVAEGTSNFGIPFPGTFLVDRQGKVTARFFEEAYQERNTISTILIGLGSADTPTSATRVETGQLDIAAYVSDEAVAPGSVFSLVFDVTPAKGIHVYAPGAKDYRVVGFTPSPDPRFVLRPMDYPASEIYFFKPLNERVPVFQRRFRLTQRMAVGASPEIRKGLAGVESLTVQGTFDYQACDDRLCFTPRSVPVSFTVRLRELDTQRAAVPK